MKPLSSTTVAGMTEAAILHAATPPRGLELLILVKQLPIGHEATVRWMREDLMGMHYSGEDASRPVYTAQSEWGPMAAIRKALSELVCAP